MKKIILPAIVLLISITACTVVDQSTTTTTSTTLVSTTTTVEGLFGITMYIKGDMFDPTWDAIDGTNDMIWNEVNSSYNFTMFNLATGTTGKFKFSAAEWNDATIFSGLSPSDITADGNQYLLKWQAHPYWGPPVNQRSGYNLQVAIPSDGDYKITLHLNNFIQYTEVTDPTDDTGGAFISVTKL